MTPDDLVSAVSPTIRDIGWAYFFAPETVAHAQSLGLDVITFYFVGRGGVLGDVEASVVHSAWGYFNPDLLGGMWEAGRAVIAPRDAGREFFAAAAGFGRARLADAGDLTAFCAAADAVLAAADPVGLPLFAAWVAEPRADDPPARATQQLHVLRELRGSAHLLAVRAVGLDDLTAHVLTRPGDMAMFGWSDDDKPPTTEADQQAHVEAEALTDRLVLPAWSVLDDAGRDAFVDGLARIEAAFTAA